MKKFAAILTVVLVLGMISGVWAADADREGKFGLRLMAYRPFDSHLQNLTSMWLGAGIDYSLKQDEDGKATRFVTVGFVDTGNTAVKGSVVPITYTFLRRKPISESRSSYTGFGPGIYRLNLEAGGGFNKTSFKPGIHAMYGQEFGGGGYFAEIQLDLLPRFQSTSWSGIWLSLGTRGAL